MVKPTNIKPEESDSKMLGAIAYAGSIILGFLAPLIIYLTAKEDKFVRFHALQSLIIGVMLLVGFIALAAFIKILNLATSGIDASVSFLFMPVDLVLNPVLLSITQLPVVLPLALLALYLYWTYVAYRGHTFKIPVITNFVLKNI